MDNLSFHPVITNLDIVLSVTHNNYRNIIPVVVDLIVVVVVVVDVLTEGAKEVGVVVVDTTYDGVGEDTLVG